MHTSLPALPSSGPRAIGSLLALLLVALLCAAGSAHAATTHVFASNFGSAGSGDGQLSLAASSGNAVNATSHAVYVADTNNARVVEFGADGGFVRAFGADVGGSGVDVCTTGCVAGTPGTAAGEFTTPTFIAIDNSGGPSDGDVYVGDTTNNVVQKFAANGALIAAWGFGGVLDGSTATGGPFGPLAGIAIDPTGNLFVYDTNANMFSFTQTGTYTTTFNTTFGVSPVGIAADSTGNLYVVRGNPLVEKVSPTGADLGTVTADNTATGLTVDLTNNDLYVDAGTTVNRFAATCNPAGGPCAIADSFGSGHLTAGAGVAVDQANHELFVADSATNDVADFTSVPLALPPTHVAAASFGSAGSGDGQLALAVNSGIAVNHATHDLYVADTNNNRIVQFSASGAFIRAWGWGVADGSAALQSCTSGCQAGISGHGAGQLAKPEFVAVDNSSGPSHGDVYVGEGSINDQAAASVLKFSASGAYLSTIDSSTVATFNNPIEGLAVDTSGNLAVLLASGFGAAGHDNDVRMYRFDQSGSLLSSFIIRRSVTDTGIAVDATGDFYVSTGSLVKLDPTGGQIGNIGGDVLTSRLFVPAVDLATNDVYVSDNANHRIARFLSSCDPAHDVCAPSESFSSDAGQPSGIAGDPFNDTVYVATPGTQQITTFLPTPALATGRFTDHTAAGVTLTGTVDPRNTAVTDCHFDYVRDADYHAGDVNPYAAGQTAACVPAPGAGNGSVAVHADVTGLVPVTAYHFRLEATNANGVSSGRDEVIPSTPPTIDSASPADVSGDSADLRARINPHRGDTSFHFQYVDDATFRASGFANASATPDADIGSGADPVAVSQHVQGLVAGTTYHYRAVATNSLGTTAGPDLAFTTQPNGDSVADTCPNAALRSTQHSAYLPDCRAYEQVSPVDKNGGDALQGAVLPVWRASTDGASFSYDAAQSYGDALSAGGVDQTYLASRTAGGWPNHALLPTQSPGGFLPFIPFLGYSQDLSKALFAIGAGDGQDDPPLAPGEPAGIKNLFLRDNDNDSWHLIDVTPPGVTPDTPVLQGTSADLGHVVFSEHGQLTSDAPALDSRPFLFDWSGGTVHLVSVDPAGNPIPGSVQVGVPNGDNPYGNGPNLHPVSDDGSRIFFGASDGVTSKLYLRKDNTTTVQVDAAQGSGPGGGGVFRMASTDGAHAFLTDDDAAGLTSDTVSGSGTNLYRFDTGTGHLIDLTPGADADVIGFAGASEDGAYAYYVANGDLDGTGPATPGDCVTDIAHGSGAFVGTCNLYVIHDGATTLVTRLDGADAPDWNGANIQFRHVTSNDAAAVSPDGTYIAFQSVRSLTGYDNTAADGASCGARLPSREESVGPVCPEVFLYHAPSADLTCASCRPSGDSPSGISTITSPDAAFDGLINSIPRYLSDTGRLFFNSADAVLPRDANGVYDVYEFEPDGTGDCRRVDGCIALVSRGTGHEDSVFRDASVDGSDAFFTTNDPLVSQDGDSNFDVYAARAGGGIAVQNPGPASGACAGDACRPVTTGVTSAPPVAASVAFVGPGNAPESRGKAAPAKAIRVSGSKRVRGTRFALSVKVPGKGRLSGSGSGVGRVTRAASKAGTYRLAFALTTKARKTLKQRHSLKVRVRVGYTPASGSASSATVTVTVKA
jgi:hypothetical protein